MTTAGTGSVERLADEWRSCGLGEGDVVLVHSDILRTVLRERGAGRPIDSGGILESFRRAVGESGTLLFPLFNFGFADGAPFDIRSTPSQMGALTEAARMHPEAVRTGHPIYSFAVLGRRAEEFRGVLNYSGYADDSPFGMLRHMGGKIAALGLPYERCMTFVHHVEEMENVPYRYHKKFRGHYTDGAGVSEVREFGLFVRDLDRGVVTHLKPLGDRLWAQGLNRGYRPDEGCGLLVVSAPELFAAVGEIIRSGHAEGMIYRMDRR